MSRLRDSSEVKEASHLFDSLLKEIAAADAWNSKKRGERLESALVDMCRRGSFKGAVVVDHQGLLVASYNAPGEVNAIAAFTTMMADTLEHAEKLLKEPNANRIGVDINYDDRAVVHRFTAAGNPYYLTIACSQDTDERSEVAVSIEQLSSIIHPT